MYARVCRALAKMLASVGCKGSLPCPIARPLASFSSATGAFLRLHCSATLRLYLRFFVNAPMTCFAVKQRCLGRVSGKIELTFARMICFCVHSRRFFAHIHIFSLFFRVFVVILDDLGGFYENLDVVGDLSRFGGRNREFLSALAKITAKILIFGPFLPQKRFQKSRLDGLRQNEMPFFLFCPAKTTRFLAQKSIFWAAWVG